MQKSLIIFGAGEIAQLAHYYFSKDTNYKVVAFTVDAGYLKETLFCEFPVVAFDELQKLYPKEEYEVFVALS